MIRRLRESSRNEQILDNIRYYLDDINDKCPNNRGYLDALDCGNGEYKVAIVDDRGRTVETVFPQQRLDRLVFTVKGAYDLSKAIGII